jgi:hypothetical protein
MKYGLARDLLRYCPEKGVVCQILVRNSIVKFIISAWFMATFATAATLPYTQTHRDVAAGGYVYVFNPATKPLQNGSNPPKPAMTLGDISSITSLITGFATAPSDGDHISNANSDGTFEDGPATVVGSGTNNTAVRAVVPEPASILLFGTLVLLFAKLAQKRLSNRG